MCVLSAIVCVLPQLVRFHFVTVRAASSRNDRRENRSSEPLSWKPARHTCKTNELAHCNASVASPAAELIWDMSDRLTADKSQRARPVWGYFTSRYTLFAVRTLRITNNWARGEWICMTRDEWVGDLCVGMCVLILSCLRHDSLTGGVWTQGVGWFKCLETTSGPPVHVNHSSAAAWTLNRKKSSSTGAVTQSDARFMN